MYFEDNFCRLLFLSVRYDELYVLPVYCFLSSGNEIITASRSLPPSALSDFNGRFIYFFFLTNGFDPITKNLTIQ